MESKKQNKFKCEAWCPDCNKWTICNIKLDQGLVYVQCDECGYERTMKPE